jgi:hypothetical protein
MAEAAAERRALVRREVEGIQRLDDEAMAGEFEMRESVVHPLLSSRVDLKLLLQVKLKILG